MLQSKSRTWVEVDLNTVIYNTRVVKEHIQDTKIMAVVKADAYGHGDVQIARVLQDHMDIDFFCVSCIDEAIRLREHNVHRPILVLGYTPPIHFSYLIEKQITQCVMSYEYAKKLDDFCQLQKQKVHVHIKVDTGMSRLGIRCVEEDYNIQDVCDVFDLKHILVEGVFSHFSVSDSIENEADLAFTGLQIERYERVLKDLKNAGNTVNITHIQNSYGCLNYPNLKYDYARPGLILIGSTSDNQIPLKEDIALIPALQWKASVSLVKTLKKGSFVSYGRNYEAQKDMKVATLSVGYADGLNRNASHHQMHVLVHGNRCPIIGNICMDQCLVDVSSVEDIKEGDVATIVGRDGEEVIYIDELSRCANTINNDSFCLISKRVPRFYIDIHD